MERSNRWPTSALAVSLTVAVLLILSLVAGAIAFWRVGRVNAELDSLRTELAAAEDRIASLESELEASGTRGSPGWGLEDLLGGLLGDGDLSGIEDLLRGLLGGEDGSSSGGLGDLGGLLGGDLASCLLGSGTRYEISNAGIDLQVAEVTKAIEEIRALEFPSPVVPTFVSSKEMADRIRRLITETYPAELVEFDTRLLTALRMLEPGYDLLAAQIDLLDTGVAGYYDQATGELVVATPSLDNSPADSLGAIDQLTLAHELIHALTDSRLDFPAIIDNPLADPDQARAVQALIEGDATLGMQRFSLAALDPADQIGMMFDPRVTGAKIGE
ncbi:MAG: hypothetical protein ACT4OP_04615 [Actinomycetota bacterium]